MCLKRTFFILSRAKKFFSSFDISCNLPWNALDWTDTCCAYHPAVMNESDSASRLLWKMKICTFNQKLITEEEEDNDVASSLELASSITNRMSAFHNLRGTSSSLYPELKQSLIRAQGRRPKCLIYCFVFFVFFFCLCWGKKECTCSIVLWDLFLFTLKTRF